jgi:hypothetical protein
MTKMAGRRGNVTGGRKNLVGPLVIVQCRAKEKRRSHGFRCNVGEVAFQLQLQT